LQRDYVSSKKAGVAAPRLQVLNYWAPHSKMSTLQKIRCSEPLKPLAFSLSTRKRMAALVCREAAPLGQLKAPIKATIPRNLIAGRQYMPVPIGDRTK
jgi:hypothetical protein